MTYYVLSSNLNNQASGRDVVPTPRCLDGLRANTQIYKYTYMFPRVFGDEFGDEFGDSINLVINLVTNSVMNFVNH